MHRFIYPVILPADPAQPMEAATKQYVDAHGGGGGGPSTSRTTVTITTGSIAAGIKQTGTVSIANGYRLYKIVTSAPCRLRLYTTIAKRDADLSRTIGVRPTGDHGLMFEFVSDATLLSADLSPLVDGFDGDENGMIPYTVDNTSGSTGSFTITLTYLEVE